ncbi:P-loop containing nucleoside triphosphate hydrolase protein, partial [Lyophyllum atratum]
MSKTRSLLKWPFIIGSARKAHGDAPQASDTAVLGAGLADTAISGGNSHFEVGAGQSLALVQSTPTQSAGAFSHARHITIHNSTFNDVQGNMNVYGAMPGDVIPNAEPLINIAYKCCPPPSHLFTGRQAILTQMEAYFQNEVGPRHVCVLYGLGGVGKTQIGYKFVETCAQKKRFTDIFFIDATTADTIKVDLVNISLAKHFGKSADDALQSLASQHQEWLLFFNNADDVKLDLSQYLPRCSHGNILITTRNPQLRLYATGNGRFSVPDLEEDDAINLLLAMATDGDTVNDTVKDQAAAIAKELSCLPLALVQAGAYISKTRDLWGYLELYRKNRALLWKAQPVQTHDDYKWTVYTTWEMSVKLLQPAAAMFLKVCSFMHHDGISEEMFAASCAAINDCDDPAVLPALRKFLDKFCQPTRTTVLQKVMENFQRPVKSWDTFRFQEIVADLQSYSLINFDHTSRVFYIHPLMHSWM